jgi:hypothetical protein
VRVSGSLVARHLQQVRSHGAEAVQQLERGPGPHAMARPINNPIG